MTFTHINDCWNYLREAKTYEELEERIGDIPNKFGIWDIEKNQWNECRVTNTYYDEGIESWDEDSEDFDIPYEDDLEEE